MFDIGDISDCKIIHFDAVTHRAIWVRMRRAFHHQSIGELMSSFVQLYECQLSPDVLRFEWEIGRSEQPMYRFTQRVAGSFGAIEYDIREWLMDWGEEWKANNVIPMCMGQEDVDVVRCVVFAADNVTQSSNPGPAIENNMSTIRGS